MPKIVDNYVLERKIGSGQFGEVYKGYNKITNVDIAVKVVKRSQLKGKFHELLENEIKVLRTCNNENIIKLYDLKKTANNFYLILEYCNEGDLQELLKKRKYLTEDEAVEFLIQILNAFKTLVQNNILHRDFKLPNILLHNGNIKIADFGFAKLLGESDMASTMLGSPLNMAPEVLNNSEYDNKADIWSIGTVFFELLYGKPPYTASNIVELLKNIQTKPLVFPKNIQKLSPVVEDVIRKMLVVDPKKRIDWSSLFSHEINQFFEKNIENNFATTQKAQDLQLSMSKFYIQNNMVIAHPAEIQKKQELNNFTINQIKNQQQNIQQQQLQQQQQPQLQQQQSSSQQQQYNGPFLKRKTERSNEEEKSSELTEASTAASSQKQQSQDSPQNTQNTELSELSNQETVREQQIRINKRNSNRILHERNIYVFLASIAEDSMNNNYCAQAELVGFLLVKKLLMLIENLKNSLQYKTNIFQLENWDLFVNSKDFYDIFMYISKEYDVFKVYFDQLYTRAQQSAKQMMPQPKPVFSEVINNNIQQNIEQQFRQILSEYIKDIIQIGMKSNQQTKPQDQQKQLWIHVDRIIDCLELNKVFRFEDDNKIQFNFKVYYDSLNNFELSDLVQKVQKKISDFKIKF